MEPLPHPPVDDPTSATELVEAALHHSDLRQAREAVQRMQQPGCLPAALIGLTAGLWHEEAQVRRRAAQGLALLGPAGWSAQAGLLEALRDPVWTVREAVVLALAGFPVTDGARSHLADVALHDRNPLVRSAAAVAWADRITDPAVEVGPALRHAHASVRRRAAHVLGRLGNKPGVVELLRNASTDGHARVRQSAAEALGECGAASALPRLVRCAFDGEPRVQRAAVAAVHKIVERAHELPGRQLIENLVRSANPLNAFRMALGDELPSAVRETVLAAAVRRLGWRKRQGDGPGDATPEAPPDLTSAAERLAEVGGSGEVVWLLGVLVEALLGERRFAADRAP